MHAFHKIASRVSPLFRGRRLAKLFQTFPFTPELRVLDVGGLPHFWTMDVPSRITLLNLGPLEDYQKAAMRPNMEWVIGDGTRLPYPDGHFDLVMSNSVIEHVGTEENQIAFAREIRRVGRAYWVQTPAFECPVEPHYFAPVVHWLPKAAQRKLIRRCTLWGLMNKPSPQIIDLAIAELRLLKRREMGDLFPDAEVWTERVLGIPKSYTAFKRLPEHARAAVPAEKPAFATAAWNAVIASPLASELPAFALL